MKADFATFGEQAVLSCGKQLAAVFLYFYSL
jgi:hypothetical protein